MSGECEKRLEEAAALFDEAAAELERAAAHARVAAQHFRDGEVPRGGAHAWAVRGHLLKAGRALDEQAVEHGERSRPVA
jgi:TPR repeat protein